MGYQNSPYLLSDPSLDSAAVDFRAFYPYTPNEVKHRKRTTSAQLKVLETIFKKDTKPNANLRNELASQLDMSARGVQVSSCLVYRFFSFLTLCLGLVSESVGYLPLLTELPTQLFLDAQKKS
jgi:hypothetical protein